MIYELFGKKLSGPLATVSGILTTKPCTKKRVAEENPEIGVITSKSIGIKEWDTPSVDPLKGPSVEPIVCEVDLGVLRNNVNLRNPGYEKFGNQMEAVYPLPNDTFFLCSIFDREKENLAIIAKGLEHIVDGYELNFSCRHSTEEIGAIGSDARATWEYVNAVRKVTAKPIFVKLPPIPNKVGEIAIAAMRGGANGLSLINTDDPEVHYHDGHAVLSRGIGGLSGRAIKDIGVRCAKEVRDAVGKDVPMIVMGGITFARDIVEYREAAGDDIICGIGTAFMGMSTNTRKKYLPALMYDLEHGTTTADEFVVKDEIMQYNDFKIKDIKKVDKDLNIFYFDKEFNCLPGQYIFTWIPGVGEKPFSVADTSPLTLAVRDVGRFTSALSDKQKGDTIYVRGPYGQGIEPVKNAYIVVGGTGAAAGLMLAKNCENPTIFLGATSEKQVLFEKELRKESIELRKGVDNGEKGEILKFLEAYIESGSDGMTFYNIGPLEFMKKAMETEIKYGANPKNVFSSLETEINCGVGVCGGCAIDGYLNCEDGTFFPADVLLKTELFT